jgi:hypothetical protein
LNNLISLYYTSYVLECVISFRSWYFKRCFWSQVIIELGISSVSSIRFQIILSVSLVLISLEDLTRCIIRATKRNKGDLILISFLFSFFFFPVCHERHHHVKISLSQLLLLIHSFNFPVCSSSSNINIVTALTISDPDPLGHRKKTCWDTNPNIDRTLPSFIYIESNPIPGYNIRDIFISTAGLDCCCVIAKHQNIVFLKRLNHKIFKFILLLTDTKFTLVECCCA